MALGPIEAFVPARFFLPSGSHFARTGEAEAECPGQEWHEKAWLLTQRLLSLPLFLPLSRSLVLSFALATLCSVAVSMFEALGCLSSEKNAASAISHIAGQYLFSCVT